jgi:hypothetical protein
MRVEICGKRWNLKLVKRRKRRRNYGTCDPNWVKGKTVEVEINHEDQLALDILLHECLHAGLPDIKEEVINQWAMDVAKIVTAQGWHR